MAVCSDGSYGVPEGLISSFPVTCADGEFRIVPDLDVDEFSGRASICRSPNSRRNATPSARSVSSDHAEPERADRASVRPALDSRILEAAQRIDLDAADHCGRDHRQLADHFVARYGGGQVAGVPRWTVSSYARAVALPCRSGRSRVPGCRHRTCGSRPRRTGWSQ